MSKLAILLLPILCGALIAAAPKPLHHTATIHEPILAKIGEYVARVPTAISHQSSTIVHDHADVAVAPIVAPALKTTSIHTPFTYAAAAAVPAAAGPPQLRSFAASPTHFTPYAPYAYAPFPFNMFTYYSPFAAAYESGTYRHHV